MSYVLEALKRADAQRERGQVPGLNAQPAGLPPADDDEPVARRGPWLAAAGIGTAAVVLLGWWLSRPPPLSPTLPPPTPAPIIVATPPARPAPAAQVIAEGAPVEPLRITPKAAPAPAAPAIAAAAKPEAAASAARITPLRELPEALRRELPPLAVGGSMYSAQAAQRLVILNGQVFHEGAQIGTDLVVEQIRPKSVVLRYKQQRFEIPL